MVKQAVETLGGWFVKNSWSMSVVIIGLIGGVVIGAAVQQNQISYLCEQIKDLKQGGTQKAHDNSERIKALETIMASQTAMLTEMRNDIKRLRNDTSLLLGRDN